MHIRAPKAGTVAVFIAGLCALPAAFGLLALAGWLPSTAVDRPPSWEQSLGGHALNAALARRARGLVNPIGPGDQTALLAGLKAYRFNCAGCHGGASDKSPWGSQDFYPRVPQFGSEPVEMTPEQAYAAIHDGVRYSGMAAWKGLLSDREMWELANFVSSTGRLPPTVKAAWKRPLSKATP